MIWKTGTKARSWVLDLDCEHNRYGQLLVEPILQLKGYPEVFALGDIADIPSNSEIPRTAQAAYQQAPIAAKNLRSRDIRDLYSNEGFLPTPVLFELLKPGYWSIHALSSQTIVQALLFSFAFLKNKNAVQLLHFYFCIFTDNFNGIFDFKSIQIDQSISSLVNCGFLCILCLLEYCLLASPVNIRYF